MYVSSSGVGLFETHDFFVPLLATVEAERVVLCTPTHTNTEAGW